ncbi:MAG: transketolase [Chloroflexota bacterium]
MAAREPVSAAETQGRRCPYNYALEDLQDTAYGLSREIIAMTTRAGSGHPSSSLSAIDVITALYFGGFMCYRPKEPEWPERDRFILSKGHGCPALYAVLAEAGFFDPALLQTLRKIESPLEGHPNMRVLPGVEASTGSLGQGLSIGLGHALAGRVDGCAYQVYVMIGDGESDEGQIWEAAMAAAKFRVGNLTAILDYNKFQQSGPVREVMPTLEPLTDKWISFGWDVREIDGHDMEAIMDALRAIRRIEDQPQLIIAHTLKGRGLSAFEKNQVNRKHGVPLTEQEAEGALEELHQMKQVSAYARADFVPEIRPEDRYGEV